MFTQSLYFKNQKSIVAVKFFWRYLYCLKSFSCSPFLWLLHGLTKGGLVFKKGVLGDLRGFRWLFWCLGSPPPLKQLRKFRPSPPLGKILSGRPWVPVCSWVSFFSYGVFFLILEACEPTSRQVWTNLLYNSPSYPLIHAIVPWNIKYFNVIESAPK